MTDGPSSLDALAPELVVTDDGPVRIVTLHRPEARNAVDARLHRALATVWRLLAADPEARAVVVTGAGRAFCGGGDLRWIATFAEDPAAGAESVREGAEVVDELLRFPLPVIAAVNGPAVGLGLSLALLCDVVLISDQGWMADPHVSVGLVAGDGGAAFWPLLTPLLRSRHLLYTGDRIGADEAVALGLATRVVAHDRLHDEAMALAHRIAAQPAAAVQGTKRVLAMHLQRALAGALPAGFAAELQTMATEEHRQRLRRLLDDAEGGR